MGREQPARPSRACLLEIKVPARLVKVAKLGGEAQEDPECWAGSGDVNRGARSHVVGWR